jgi:hypothetical protein
MSNYESKKSFEGVPPFATATEEEIQVSERFERGNWFTPIEPKPIYDGYAPARPFPKLVTEFGQPAPIQNDKPALWPMVIEDFKNYYGEELIGKTPHLSVVIADMNSRDQFGRKKYGVPLQMHNGRNAVNDAYEELLDGAVYLKQAIEEGTNYDKSFQEIIYLKKAYELTFKAISFVSEMVKR